MNTILSDKAKDLIAQTRIIQAMGRKFYSLSIPEREKLRKEYRLKVEMEASNVIKTPTLTVQQVIDTPKVVETPAAPRKFNLGFTLNPNQNTEPSEAFAALYKDVESLIPEAKPYAEKPLAALEPVHLAKKHQAFSLSIELNAKQTLGAEYAESGKSFVFTGKAGTGKTTGCREIAKRLVNSGKLGEHDFKVPGGERVWAPSIAICSYTNRATDNIRNALHKDPELEEILQHNVLTIHKLLEFEPIFYDIEDPATGEYRTTMRFEPQRTAQNPLRITHLIIEESSMLGTDLGMLLLSALPKGCQIIYVGDINQLPPIFAKSMLNYALILLPVIELTEVYRQALESPILSNAHLCLEGKALVPKKPFFQVVSGVNLATIPGESKVVNNLMNSLKAWYTTKEEDGSTKYDPNQDIILSPWNKGDCGTSVLNSHIAGFIGKERNALVYEIYAGMRKVYLAVGDRVMINKQDGFITKINHNGRYLGKMPRPASTEMTRFGIMTMGNKDATYEDIELSLSSYAALNVDDIQEDNKEAKKQEASHVVTIILDSGAEVVLNSIGEFGENVFSLGYALTVHKAQGCEWRKVIILIHRNHAISLNREMLYTAITRAREYCIIVDLCNMIPTAIANQRIKGNSVEEKIEWFNSEISLAEPVPVIP